MKRFAWNLFLALFVGLMFVLPMAEANAQPAGGSPNVGSFPGGFGWPGTYFSPGYSQGYGFGNRYGYQSPYYAPPRTVVPQVMTPAPDGGQIVLFVPADVPGGISYRLNGQPFTLPAGGSQNLVNDRVWTIEFAPAPGQPVTRYTVVSGNYKFKPSNTGMGLFRTQDQPLAKPAAVQPPVPNPTGT